MAACQAAGVEPSLLLHPLDFLGGDEEPDLGFFPAMKMAGAAKRDFVRELLADFSRRFRVVSLDEYAATVALRKGLKEVALRHIPSAEPRANAPRSELRSPRLSETEFSVETVRQ